MTEICHDINDEMFMRCPAAADLQTQQEYAQFMTRQTISDDDVRKLLEKIIDIGAV